MDEKEKIVADRRHYALKYIVARIKAGEFVANPIEGDPYRPSNSFINRNIHFKKVLRETFGEGLNLPDKLVQYIEQWSELECDDNETDNNQWLYNFAVRYKIHIERIMFIKEMFDETKP